MLKVIITALNVYVCDKVPNLKEVCVSAALNTPRLSHRPSVFR